MPSRKHPEHTLRLKQQISHEVQNRSLSQNSCVVQNGTDVRGKENSLFHSNYTNASNVSKPIKHKHISINSSMTGEDPFIST